MASLSAVSMATPITTTTTKTTFFNPLSIKPQWAKPMGQRPNVMGFKVQASLKEKAVTGLTATALTVSMMIPDIAEAAELQPSLKNFLGSIVAGGVVLTAILGAIIAVSNFDPVKRA
uniref:PSBX n=2 Tax=Silene latifolia TaxID=37657 RepID=R9UBI9_SILLA|nr:PSBX [Silene latifolia]